MPIQIVEIAEASPHRWALGVATCDLTKDDDELVTLIAQEVRKAYGEEAILRAAEQLANDPVEPLIFDETAIRAALRKGLPDPAAEGNKPPQLTVYRSQPAEIATKVALIKAYGINFPVSPQQASLNPNQPILGFDGWGITEPVTPNQSLVLLQVKATDAAARPPPDAEKLAAECVAAPRDASKLVRALATMVQLVDEAPIKKALATMLMEIGRNQPIRITICPVIMRGVVSGHKDDLLPVHAIAKSCEPAVLHGLVLTIGVDLTQFGKKVMELARTPV